MPSPEKKAGGALWKLISTLHLGRPMTAKELAEAETELHKLNSVVKLVAYDHHHINEPPTVEELEDVEDVMKSYTSK